MEFIAVFIGGGIGASLRYLFSFWANKKFGLTYWATFLINVLGCLFLGFVATFAILHPNSSFYQFKIFLTTGITGGFTTFSTFSLENVNLLKEGNVFKSVVYMGASLFFGLFGIYLGFWLANSL